MTDDIVVERLPPAEAFERVAHEARLAIIRSLDEAEGPLSFAELRKRSGIEDPGQFNYHLRKLDGRFVKKREPGYSLAPAGKRIVGAVLSGGYTMAMDAEPVRMEATCNFCGGGLETRFDEDQILITCRECGFDVTTPEIPPGILDGVDRERAPAIVDQWLRRNYVSAAYGFCPKCDGQVDRTLTLPGEEAAPDWFEGDIAPATLVTTCSRCGHWWHSVIEHAVLTHPAVVAFHFDHGVDLRETPTWDLDWLEPNTATVTDEDPLRVAVPITVADETRRFVFDRDLDLVAETDA